MRFDAKEFGGRIRDLRKKQGITQEQLSIMLNVSANHLAKVETGSRCCSIELLQDLSSCLNVRTDYLLNGDAPQGIPGISGKPCISGTYPDVFVRLLAVWICFQKISPTQQSARERVEKITYQNKILHNESSPGSLHAPKIFRRYVRGRGRPVEKYIK